jgi:glucose-1-phosphate cytidylyltransferase
MHDQTSDSLQTMPPAMILCGGQGSRLRDVTELLPKPMVPIGAQPIVWHIMRCYAAFGVKRFILCLGYKSEAFIDYFLNYHARTADFTVQLDRPGHVTFHGPHDQHDWQVTLANTGDSTMTGARIARASRYLRSDDNVFFLTYGDAVADIDFDKLLAHHRIHGKTLTLSAVHPSGRFGELGIDADGDVTGFNEKPETEKGFINGGFMVADRERLQTYLNDDPQLVFETGPMHAVQSDDQMSAYQHEGFWQCMDNPREHALLNRLWEAGDAPWTRYWSKG